MNSGIVIGEDILPTYKQLANKRQIRWIIYKPSDDGTAVEIEATGQNEETWDMFKEKVPKD